MRVYDRFFVTEGIRLQSARALCFFDAVFKIGFNHKLDRQHGGEYDHNTETIYC